MNKPLGILGLILLLAACGNPTPDKKPENDHTVDSSQHSLAGHPNSDANNGSTATGANNQTTRLPAYFYTGRLPCADCPGITVYLLLGKSNYSLQRQYDDRPNVFDEKGYYSFSDSLLVLTDTANRNQKAFFRLQGDRLLVVDSNKQIITALHNQPMVLHPATLARNSRWEQKEHAGIRFIAMGNEPSWSAEISDGDSLQFNSINDSSGKKIALQLVSAKNRSIRYEGKTGKQKLVLTIVEKFTGDGMSDIIYPFQTTLLYKGSRYNGTGVNLIVDSPVD